jgi:heat-inducible transcriptional repressor
VKMDERKMAVLRAIVEDYVQTHEPVGSKTLADRHALGVSSATIRNDMAALEEEGLISAPHTSAGRIPTDKGYRLFVDRLNAVKPMSQAEKRAISNFLDGAVDLDEVMTQTVRLLAALTRQVAIVQYPSLVRTAVRHVELINLGPSRVMLVLIADTGRIEQRTIEISHPISEELLQSVRERLNAVVAGQLMHDVAEKISNLADHYAVNEQPFVRSVYQRFWKPS